MTRREDWPERLLNEIEVHSGLSMDWGVSDCFVFPMDCVKAMTGVDPWADVRTYNSELGAAKLMRERGFENVGDAFAAKFTEIPPSLAQRGDIGVIEAEAGVCGVVFVGSDVVGKDPVRGIKRAPRAAVTRAFKVE